MYRDQRHDMNFFHAVDAATITTTTTTTACDTRGYNCVTFLLTIGSDVDSAAGGLTSANYWKIRIQHGLSNAAADFSDVTDGRTILCGSGSAMSTALTSGTVGVINDVYSAQTDWGIGYVGDRRYVRMILEAVASAPNLPVGIVNIREPLIKPAT